jgi:hypothetical protein
VSKSLIFGAPGRIRTHDPLVRSQVLYPTELRALEEGILAEADSDSKASLCGNAEMHMAVVLRMT